MLSQAHGNLVSGFVAQDVVQSQKDATIGPAFVSGGKKYVSLKNLGPTMEELNKKKKKVTKAKSNK